MDRTICRIGFWAGIAAFISTTAFVVVQLLQLAGVFSFPIDEILIYGTSLMIVIPFILEILALHYITPPAKRFWSHAALVFTILYAVFVTSNYVIQLATVIPMKLKGAAAGIAVLEQTPHSMFWNYDALGYIFMGLATLIALPLFERTSFQRWVRLAFLANAIMTPFIAIVYFYPTYSTTVLMLGMPWGITAPMAMLLLAVMFNKMPASTNS
jgi:hypothetical protein